MKQCPRCLITKDYFDFNKSSKSKDGHASYCRSCQKEYSSKRYEKTRGRKYPKEKFVDGKRYCTVCKEYKELSSFRTGNLSWCIECNTEKDRQRYDKNRVYPRKENNKGQIHCRHCEKYLNRSAFWGNDLSYCRDCKKKVGMNSNLKKFNLTMESYSELEKSQNSVCAICQKEETNKKRLSIDHDHSCCKESGSCGNCIRGLLCFSCNAMLGNARDSIEVLESAIKYLKIQL